MFCALIEIGAIYKMPFVVVIVVHCIITCNFLYGYILIQYQCQGLVCDMWYNEEDLTNGNINFINYNFIHNCKYSRHPPSSVQWVNKTFFFFFARTRCPIVPFNIYTVRFYICTNIWHTTYIMQFKYIDEGNWIWSADF